MSFAAVHEFELSTGIEHCTSGNFLETGIVHLVVAGGTQLELYEHVEQSKGAYALRLVKSFGFFGTVQGLATIPPEAFKRSHLREGRDALLISFDYGKLSVVQFSGLGSAMETLEIIDLEDKPYNTSRYRIKGSGQARGTNLSSLTAIKIDPASRCCATLLYDSQLCVFPFQGKQQGTTASHVPTTSSDTEGANATFQPPSAAEGLLASCLIDGALTFSLSAMGVDGSVLDAVFLDGYFQPTLLILHQPLATGNPILYMRTSSFVATMVTLDLKQGTVTQVWRLSDLPHDSRQLIAVPAVRRADGGRGAEGAMLITTNSIYYLHSRYCSGAHINGFSDFSAAKLTAQFPVTKYHFGATLDAARCMFVSPRSDPSVRKHQKMLVAKRDGLMSIVTLVPSKDQPSSIETIDVAIAAHVTIPCSLCAVGDHHIFVGSRMGDSQLLKYTFETNSGASGVHAAQSDTAPASKRLRLPFEKGSEKIRDADEFLYGENNPLKEDVAAASATKADVRNTGGAGDTGLTFEPIDWLESRATGPIVSAAVGNVGNVDSHEFELLAAAGKDRCGALYKIRHGLHVDCVAVIVAKPPPTSTPLLRAMAFSVRTQPATSPVQYVALTSKDATTVLESGHGVLKNVATTQSDRKFDFHSVGGETLTMTAMLSGQRVLQVYQEVRPDDEFSAGVRLLDSTLSVVQDILVHDDEDGGGMGIDRSVAVRSVATADRHATLVFTDGGVKHIFIDDDEELCVADPDGLVPPDVLEGDDSDDDEGGEHNEDEDSDDEAEPAEIMSVSLFELSQRESTKLFAQCDTILNPRSQSVETPADAFLYDTEESRAPSSSCSTTTHAETDEPGVTATLAVLAWSDGSVQIYSLGQGSATYKLVFQCFGVADSRSIVRNCVDHDGKLRQRINIHRPRAAAKIVEAVVAPLNDCTGFESKVLTVTMDTGALHVYEFRRGARCGVFDQSAPLVLTKVEHQHVVHEGPRRHSGRTRDRKAAAKKPQVEEEPHSGFRARTLFPFQKLGNRTGLFHCSRGHAAWIVIARGAIRVLSHNNSAFSKLQRDSDNLSSGIGNSVVSFAPIIAPDLFGEEDASGFVATSRHGHAALFQIPDVVPPDGFRNELTVSRCAALKSTPHHVVYLSKAAVERQSAKFIVQSQRHTAVDYAPHYAVALSESMAYAPSKMKVADPRLDLNIQKRELCTPNKKFGTARVWVDRYSVHLFRDGSRSVGNFKLKEFENVMAMQLLQLRDATVMPTRPFVAVGTAFQQKAAFNVEAAGRLILLRISEWTGESKKGGAVGTDSADSAQGKKSADAKKVDQYTRTCDKPCLTLEFESSLDLNAPCSAICQVGDHVVVGMGPKVRVYRWYKRELEMCGFYDSRIHTMSLRVVKDTYVALADVAFSVQFLKWEENQTTVVVKSEDQQHLPAYVADFLVHGRKLGIVATDECGNLQIFEYAPQDLRSGVKAHKLLTPAAMHLGSQVVVLVPQNLRATQYQGEGLGVTDLKSQDVSQIFGPSDAKTGLLFATLDGGVGTTVPMPEHDFRRLESLQRQMASRALGHLAGCNPRYFREYRQGTRGEVRVHDRPMLDGRLLLKFTDLDFNTQREIAYHSGDADVDVLLSNIAQLRALAGF